jgi:hypothetical protein
MNKPKFDFILKERNELPFAYNETKIVIMPKDSATIFIYWDIADSTIFDLRKKNIHLNIGIRFRNLENHDYYFINPSSNSKDWFFNLKHTSLKKNNLIADLGVYDNNGDFLILNTSNSINLPNETTYKKDYHYWRRLRLVNNEDSSFDYDNDFALEDIFSSINSTEFMAK